jgi:septum site-determining protein MinC
LFNLKIFKSGIVFYIDRYDKLETLFKEIDNKMHDIRQFFDDSEKIMIKIENFKEKIHDIPKIIEKFESYNLKVKGILTEHYDEKETPIKREEDKETTLIIIKNIRSGQKLNHTGHLIIVGNVHSGSEITANGSIVIFGQCSGIVRAGIKIKPSYILALSMNTPLVQIGEVKHQVNNNYKNPVFIYEKGGKLFFDEFKKEEEL